MHVLSASPWETFWRLRAPRSVPLLFASLRISATTSVIGAIVGEWIGSDRGLGAVIIQSTFNYQAERLFAAVLLASLSGIIFFAIVGRNRADLPSAGIALELGMSFEKQGRLNGF